VLVHSKRETPDEVLAFAARWDRETPLMCVPTIYKDTKVSDLHEAGYKVVVFANHGIRAAIRAMSDTFATLKRQMFTGSVEDQVAPLSRVYDIIGVDKMRQDEKSFMPAESGGLTAIVLAAGVSPGLMPLVAERPKAMLDVKGNTILGRQVEVLNACGVKNIAVVRGYNKDAINLPNLRYYDNDAYAESGELMSMLAAKKEMHGSFLMLYGDLLFEESILQKLLKSSADISIVVDRSWRENGRPQDARGVPDLVVLEDAQEIGYRFVGAERPHKVRRISNRLEAAEAHGEFVGMALFSERGAQIVRELIAQLQAEHTGRLHDAASLVEATFPDLLQELIERGYDVQAVDVYKGWLEVDTFEDYKRAWALIK
jgi:phosphoenolpyruvate phosphomutase